MIQFDQTENIPAAVMESPALFKQCTEHSNPSFLYPKKWQGRIPLKIKMGRTVTSDLPLIIQEDLVIAIGGNVHWCWVNSYGAVSIVFEDNTMLGVKPDEFEVVEFHKVIK